MKSNENGKQGNELKMRTNISDIYDGNGISVVFGGERRTRRKKSKLHQSSEGRRQHRPEVFLPDWLQELQYFARNEKHKQNGLKLLCWTDPHNYKPNQTEPFSLSICVPLTSTTKGPGQRFTFFLTWVLGHKF